jgi:hypothetical protein
MINCTPSGVDNWQEYLLSYYQWLLPDTVLERGRRKETVGMYRVVGDCDRSALNKDGPKDESASPVVPEF